MANRVTAEEKKILVELGYVEFVHGNMTGSWKCKKCPLESKGRPNRIVSHLLCMKDKGVKICTYMDKNPGQREELARRLGRNPQAEQRVIPTGALLEDNNNEAEETNGVGFEMLNSIHQGQSSQPDSTQPFFPRANPDQREELARRLAETNAVCSEMINTIHQGQSSQPDSTQPFFPRAHPDEREEPARGLGRNPQLEQIDTTMEETSSDEALLEDYNDGAEETNAMGLEMINTTHEGQSFRPDPTQPSFPRGGMGMCMDDPIFTPPLVNNYRMNDLHVHPLQDGATIDPSRAVASMDIEGQQQLQLRPGEHDIMNNLGDAENRASRAVISNVCANGEHHPDVPDLGSAGSASPDVRITMQNAVSQEKGSKKRKCAPGSGTGETGLQLDNSEQSSSISVSNLIISSPETSDASMPVPRETCTPPSHGQERACVPNTNNDVVRGTNDVDSEPNNTIHQGQSSLPDSAHVSSSQGGMGMGLGDQIPPPLPPQVNDYDHMNDQQMHPLQDGVGTDASTPGNAFGGGVAREPDLANPPPRPPNFPPDSWDFYLQIDKKGFFPGSDDLLLYKFCISHTDEEDMKRELAYLALASTKLRNHLTNALDDSNRELDLQFRLYKSYFDERRIFLGSWWDTVDEFRRQIKEEAEQGVPMLGTKRKMEMKCWLGYVGRIASEVSILDVDAMNAKSASEILPLLKRIEGLIGGVGKLIKMGKCLLNPVPKDLLSWNPSFMDCGSLLQNQMPSPRFPQQV